MTKPQHHFILCPPRQSEDGDAEIDDDCDRDGDGNHCVDPAHTMLKEKYYNFEEDKNPKYVTRKH